MSSVLLMDWKQEPSSPPSGDELSWVSEDAALYWTSAVDNGKNLDEDASECESKAEVAAKLLNDLEHLEDLDEWIKSEEPFSNWLEEKMLPPMFEMESSLPTPVKMEDIKPPAVPDTQSLLKEFETVFDAVELTHGALTPPQSPPYEQPHVLATLEPIAAQPLYAMPARQLVYNVPEKMMASVAAVSTPIQPRPAIEFLPPPATPQPDVAHELAVVEELVRTRVEDMVQWSGPSSPSSNSSSSSSNFGDCSSDDPEWIPEPVDALPYNYQETPVKNSRKRSKPYSRNVEEKKSRKKEQNKNAATRYRMKKKAEVAEILEEERIMISQNEELENKISDVQREIKYLKNLMRDLFKAKGLIN